MKFFIHFSLIYNAMSVKGKKIFHPFQIQIQWCKTIRRNFIHSEFHWAYRKSSTSKFWFIFWMYFFSLDLTKSLNFKWKFCLFGNEKKDHSIRLPSFYNKKDLIFVNGNVESMWRHSQQHTHTLHPWISCIRTIRSMIKHKK